MIGSRWWNMHVKDAEFNMHIETAPLMSNGMVLDQIVTQRNIELHLQLILTEDELAKLNPGTGQDMFSNLRERLERIFNDERVVTAMRQSAEDILANAKGGRRIKLRGGNDANIRSAGGDQSEAV
jgi:hypothetical protein